jgi:hypothetical protein
MKDKNIKYILFIFAKHKDQEKFVKILAEEIIGITDSTDIKYYYGKICNYRRRKTNYFIKY